MGMRPTYWWPYNGSTPNEARVDALLALFDLPPARRPSLFTLYISIVDSAGHSYGPDAAQVNSALRQADDTIGRLVEGLRVRGAADKANIIVVADHGMATISDSRIVRLDQLIDTARVDIVAQGPNAMLNVRGGDPRLVDEVVRNLSAGPPQVRAWRKDRIPVRLHYGTNRRVAEVVATVDSGWMLQTSPTISYRGTHGYDPADADMAALFIAHGPSFRTGSALASFENVHLYALFCKLLGLVAAPSNGTAQVFAPILR